MTILVDESLEKTTSVQEVEVQNVTVESVAAPMNGGEITFTYRDMYDQEWTTRPVELPLVKTFGNRKGMLSVNHFNWVDTEARVTTISTVLQSPGYYEHTLSGAAGTLFPRFVRKGDWIVFSPMDETGDGDFSHGEPDHTKVGGYCLLQVYEDITSSSTKLKTVHDVSRGACHLTTSTQIYVFAAWTVLSTADASSSGPALPSKRYEAVAGATATANYATAFDASTGTLTVTAVGSGILAKHLPPGSWIRVGGASIDAGSDGGYCDMQVSSVQANADVTSVTVATSSLTSTNGNGQYSVNVCGSWTMKSYYVNIIKQHKVMASAATPWPTTPTDKYVIAAVTADSVVTITRTSTDNSAKDFSATAGACEDNELQPGALVYLYTATGFSCACQVTASPRAATPWNEFTCTTPPAVAGVSLTSCAVTSHTAFATAAIGELMVMAGAGSVYFTATDEGNLGQFGALASVLST